MGSEVFDNVYENNLFYLFFKYKFLYFWGFLKWLKFIGFNLVYKSSKICKEC